MDAAYAKRPPASKSSKVEPKPCPNGRAHMVGGTCECGWCWYCAKREKQGDLFEVDGSNTTLADMTLAFAYHDSRIKRLESVVYVAVAFLVLALAALGWILAR